MRRRLRSNNTNLIKLAMLGVVAMASGFFLTSFLGSKSATQALSATEFQAGRIIDDSIFYNPNTMTAAEIDAFIDSHSPACDMWGTQKVYGNVTRAEYVKQLRAQGYTKYHDPPFVCVSEYYENPETHKTNFETGGKKEAGMLSAGEIIYRAAHEYSINPQVLLVMLKKESYVWGDDWPHSFQYNTVMGYACPDGAPCDSKYFGFYKALFDFLIAPPPVAPNLVFLGQNMKTGRYQVAFQFDDGFEKRIDLTPKEYETYLAVAHKSYGKKKGLPIGTDRGIKSVISHIKSKITNGIPDLTFADQYKPERSGNGYIIRLDHKKVFIRQSCLSGEIQHKDIPISEE